MGQDVLRPATVFGYFPSEYSVPRTPLKGPEFGTLSGSTYTKRVNFVAKMVYRAISRFETEDTPNGTFINPAAFMPLASDPARLVDALDALFLHGTMSPAMRAAVVEAVAAVPTSDRNFLRNRTQAAIYLVLSSPQYKCREREATHAQGFLRRTGALTGAALAGWPSSSSAWCARSPPRGARRRATSSGLRAARRRQRRQQHRRPDDDYNAPALRGGARGVGLASRSRPLPVSPPSHEGRKFGLHPKPQRVAGAL